MCCPNHYRTCWGALYYWWNCGLFEGLEHVFPWVLCSVLSSYLGERQSHFSLPISLLVDPFAAAAKSLQSCLTLCDPRDGSPPGSPVPGILQAGTLEWVAISFSNAWKWKAKAKSFSRVRLFATAWTAAYQAPPFMGFSRQEYWSGVPFLLVAVLHIKRWWYRVKQITVFVGLTVCL